MTSTKSYSKRQSAHYMKEGNTYKRVMADYCKNTYDDEELISIAKEALRQHKKEAYEEELRSSKPAQMLLCVIVWIISVLASIVIIRGFPISMGEERYTLKEAYEKKSALEKSRDNGGDHTFEEKMWLGSFYAQTAGVAAFALLLICWVIFTVVIIRHLTARTIYNCISMAVAILGIVLTLLG